MFSLVAAAVAAVPCEYVVDCSGWTGPKRTEVTFRYETRDGRTVAGTAELNPGSDAAGAVLAFTLDAAETSWRVEKVGQTGFILRGSKASPIKRVTFTGDGWVPVLHRRFATAPKAPNK